MTTTAEEGIDPYADGILILPLSGGTTDDEPVSEREKVLEKLRSLGYAN